MNTVLQFLLLPMLIASILLQFSAVFLTFRPMRLSRNAPAWTMIFDAPLMFRLYSKPESPERRRSASFLRKSPLVLWCMK